MLDWQPEAAAPPGDQYEDLPLANLPGLIAGTEVATSFGWRAVEWVRPGDEVLTFDGGLRPVLSCETDRVGADDAALIEIPKGAIGNSATLTLSVGDFVMIESDLAELMHDVPFVLMPARTLEGFRGINSHTPPEGTDRVRLAFDRPEMVFLRAGTMILCADADLVPSDPASLIGEGAMALGTREATAFLALATSLDAEAAEIAAPF